MSPSIPDRATAPPGEPSPIADEHAAPQPGHRLPAAPLWFKRAIFYEIHIRGFFDANGDGSGDFRGLIEKLDYLHWLGIDCIWLLPMYPSPLRDGGYDIASFATIHPDYGTVDDFRLFVDLAHQRGIRVIADLVLNHTSIDHPWFEESRSSPSSPRRDWYVWSDTDDRYKDAPIIFSDTERSNWTWDPVAGQYYWHRFFHHQPDLNYENPEVQEAPPHPVLTGHSIRPRRSACRESRGRVWRKVSRVAPARAVTSPRRGAKCAGARAARRGSSCACCAASRSISWPGRRASRRAGSARGARSSCSPEVWARLRLHGVGTSRKRVLRLTREAGLLAPTQGGVHRALRLDRARRRQWPGAALRRRAVLSLRALPMRDRSPRHRPQPRLPLRARDQRGCAEKFIQTLKEQVLWIERFAIFEELRAAVRQFARTYNREWLLERRGYRTPIEAREHLLALAPAPLT